MGKAKFADDASFPIDSKTALALEPEDRAEWLSTACKLVKQGVVKVSQLYDVVSRDKFSASLPDKVGIRMLRTLQKHMRIFSDKQQRFLSQSTLVVHFQERKAALHAAQNGAADNTEGKAASSAQPAIGDSTAMEEMMARCRSFVRENASLYEKRKRDAQEAVIAAERAREWEQIDLWHQPLEAWEKAQMTSDDWRLHFRLMEAEEAQRRAIQKWRKESLRRKREDDIQQRLDDERAILDEERQAEKRRRSHQRWLLEEEERREQEEQRQRGEERRKGDDRQRAEERIQAEQRRRQEDRYRADRHRWEEAPRRRDGDRRVDRRRLEEEEDRNSQRKRRYADDVDEERRRRDADVARGRRSEPSSQCDERPNKPGEVDAAPRFQQVSRRDGPGATSAGSTKTTADAERGQAMATLHQLLAGSR